MGFRQDLPHTLEPQNTRIAHPATHEPRTDYVLTMIHTASFGMDNYWRHWKKALGFLNMSDGTLYELMTSEELDDYFNFSDRRYIRALHRRYVDDCPQFKTTKPLSINCLDVHEPHDDKSLRENTGFRPQTMVMTPILFRSQRVVKRQVSEMQTRHSSGVGWKACAGCIVVLG